MGLTFKENLVTKGSEMGFDYGRCDRKLLSSAYKDWTGMGGTKFPLEHKAFAEANLASAVAMAGKNVGRGAAPAGRRTPAFLPSSPLHIVLDG